MVPVPGGLNRYKFILSSQQILKLNMMNSYAEKTVEQSKTIADNGTKSSFINNRPEALTMQNLKDSANNSAQVQQLKAYQTMADQAIIQRQANTTGMPDNLKSGIENLSGYSMSDVKVHYNSDKPAQLNAHAYAQGTQIHLASGQEKHLPHEAWHVVQQKQGRVKPTMQLKGKVAINDDAGLEKEADEMGAMALQMKTKEYDSPTGLIQRVLSENTPVQRYALVAGPSFQGRVGNLNFDTAISLDVINLRAWVEEAAVHNFPALWRVAELVLLNADSIEQDDPTLVDFILQRAERAKAEIEVEGAEMIYSDNNFANLRPVDTVVMRAINTGDKI